MKEGITVREFKFGKEEFMKKLGLKGKFYSCGYGVEECYVKVEVK